MRLEDESAAIRELFPTAYTDIAIAVTELGGQSTLMLLLATLFWLSSQRRTALVIAYALAGVSLLLAIKTVLGLPRPPAELFLKPLESDTYGFPSGHAFAATVVYGGLVSAYDRTRDFRAVAAAGTLILTVSLSRVVLGVHYIGDVIIGVAIGFVFLGAMNRATRGEPQRAFAIALGLSVLAMLAVGSSSELLLGLGSSIGGLFASRRLDRLPPSRSALEDGVLVVVGIGYVVAITTLESVVSTVEPLLVPLYAALLAGIVLAPAAVGRLGFGALEPGRR
ncbi:phosphatase PAP2 family protein [Natronococcus occultus]|uniref:PAP2 family phosphatase n=1 Tax=Natronococcus occultus SP4 TaxID=694430 RepID=L0JZM8_9EURY|nr:phosphatase PAP2 family protein [Natronococcus occultus]AGB38502.1 PAP2 family phosphatase [Natronococcus occultus SP4]